MPLTLDEIEDCAMRILDRYGLGDLSMRRIAATLGVAPGALYWHIGSKQELLINLATRVVGQPSLGTGSWDAQLIGWARQLRQRLLAHRDGAEVVASAVALAGPDRLDPASELRAMLDDAGLDRPEAAAATVLHYVLGQTMTDQARAQFKDLGIAAGAPLADSFEFGLATIAAGLAAVARDGGTTDPGSESGEAVR